MKYNCEICNYGTYDFGNFSRHKQSKKHIKNTELNRQTVIQYRSNFDPPVIQKKSQKHDQNDKIIFECKHCFACFTSKTNMYRHMRSRCKIKKYDDSRIKNLENQVSKLIDVSLTNTDAIKTASQTMNKSLSTINYAIKNFQNAPPIGILSGEKLDGFIEYEGNTDRSIEEIIIHHFEKRKLHQLLGDLVVKEYKKENPKKQSVWSSDVSRLTFIIRQVVGDTKSNKWMVDKNGVDLTKLIIQPLVEKVIEILREFVNKCHSKIQKIEKINRLNNELEYITRERLRNMEKANSVIMSIKLKKMNTEILKYIAPYFNLKIKQEYSDNESSEFSDN